MLSTDTFLAPANSSFDFKQLAPKPTQRRTDLVVQNWMQGNNTQSLSSGERLPLYLALTYRELAISTTGRAGYTHVGELDLYIPERHEVIVTLVRQELADPEFNNIPHGSPDIFKKCEGPLCRRARRNDRLVATHLAKQRAGYRQRVDPINMRLKHVPQYYAVDPILVAFTILSHRQNPPNSQLTAEQKEYIKVHTTEDLISYLKSHYEKVVK